MLAEGLKLEQGQPFNQQKLQADTQKITDKYGALGHIEAKISPDIQYREQPGEVDVVYDIKEGDPFYVGRILITGNHTTKDNVIRRELRLHPGELFDTTAARRSESELRRTQLFLANYQAGTGPTITPLGEGTNLRDISQPQRDVDVEVRVDEAQTGRLLFGVGVNSDAGLLGNLIISEQNFDLFRWPASFGDFLAGDAFRGGGQEFRLEAAPGTQFSRYLISWREPHLLDSPYSLGLSGHFFQRNYREYDEERAGGTISIGHEFTDQIRGALGLRIENVNISDPDVPTPPDLLEVLGDNFLTALTLSLEHDTRDNPFIPSCGHFAQVAFEQGFGDFSFPKVSLEGRQYWTVTERIDGSGKNILSLRGTVGFAGDDTPMFERFFAGGFRNFRGFEFRGVGPSVFDVHVGGEFMLLGSVEYQLPITADDTLQMVFFSDFGTVEEDVRISDFRVTAGLGLRVIVPMLGPVPLAFDFAFPLHSADTDDEQVFSFFIGFFR
jgi:outer membrane protein insertion porin family